MKYYSPDPNTNIDKTFSDSALFAAPDPKLAVLYFLREVSLSCVDFSVTVLSPISGSTNFWNFFFHGSEGNGSRVR